MIVFKIVPVISVRITSFWSASIQFGCSNVLKNELEATITFRWTGNLNKNKNYLNANYQMLWIPPYTYFSPSKSATSVKSHKLSISDRFCIKCSKCCIILKESVHWFDAPINFLCVFFSFWTIKHNSTDQGLSTSTEVTDELWTEVILASEMATPFCIEPNNCLH